MDDLKVGRETKANESTGGDNSLSPMGSENWNCREGFLNGLDERILSGFIDFLFIKFNFY